jgi:uncharacterized repeat protein (TIGR03803 family)
MKPRIKREFLLQTLFVGLGLTQPSHGTAQSFSNIYTFSGAQFHPTGVAIRGSTLYGTAGGDANVFKINTDGSGFTNLYHFAPLPLFPPFTNSSGAGPNSGLAVTEHTLYGTSMQGGSAGVGTLFKVDTDGTDFTVLHNFLGSSDGGMPYNGLTILDGRLYGTANGGSFGRGTLFAINVDGTGFTNLHHFTGGNNGGHTPRALLTASGDVLFGTAQWGGSSNKGVVFRINTNGTGFTNLHSFTGGSDGEQPLGNLVLSGNRLFGTANAGSAGSFYGTIFIMNTDGSDFKTIHSFAGGKNGGFPVGMVISGDELIGTSGEGVGSYGTLYRINTDGTGFSILHLFQWSDGAYPQPDLALFGNILYGATSQGGSSRDGTLFSLFIPPQLRIMSSGRNAILSWPTNAPGLTLQFTTNLSLPVWTPVGIGPALVNGQYTVTNPISGTQQFYRLSQ